MGAKNHQPCNEYLPDSIKLSRALSHARVEMETANIHLEDLLLAELAGGHRELDNILISLNNTVSAFRSSLNSTTDLRTRMMNANYQDLPTLNRLDLDALGRALAEEKVVHQHSWNRAVNVMKSKGFYSILNEFDDTINQLIAGLLALIERISKVTDVSINGEIGVMLEQNKKGNFKKQFAKLFSELSSFEQYFLASSILSTELWYAFNGFGSLTEISARVAAA